MNTQELNDAFHVLASSPNYTTFELKSNKLKVTVVPATSAFNTIHSQVVYHVGSAEEGVGYTGSTRKYTINIHSKIINPNSIVYFTKKKIC